MTAIPAAPVQSGLEGVVAFATRIAEPDRDGGALRYRGIDLDELAGTVPYEQVWSLLVDGALRPASPAAPHALEVRSGDHRADLQAAIAAIAPRSASGRSSTSPPSRRAPTSRAVGDGALARRAVRARRRPPGRARAGHRHGRAARRALPHRVARRARPAPRPCDRRLLGQRGRARHECLDIRRARVIASTGADVAAALSGAVGALSGPLHGGAPSRVLAMLDDVQRTGDADGWVRAALDRGERIMGFGHRVYRAEDPRARVLRRRARAGLGGSRPPRRSSAPPWRSCAPASPTACSPPTSSSGLRSCSTSPTCRPRSSPRCSPAPGPRAGRRTSSTEGRGPARPAHGALRGRGAATAGPNSPARVPDRRQSQPSARRMMSRRAR